MSGLTYDLVSKLRQARANVRDLCEEVEYLKAELEKTKLERDLLLELIPKIKKGFEV
jgi:hypothetical protein